MYAHLHSCAKCHSFVWVHCLPWGHPNQDFNCLLYTWHPCCSSNHQNFINRSAFGKCHDTGVSFGFPQRLHFGQRNLHSGKYAVGIYLLQICRQPSGLTLFSWPVGPFGLRSHAVSLAGSKAAWDQSLVQVQPGILRLGVVLEAFLCHLGDQFHP